MPGPVNARADDPLERELAGLRRQLADTQAALDDIATRVGLVTPGAVSGPASGRPRSGPAPYNRTRLLSILSAAATAATSPANVAAAAAAAGSAARQLLGTEQQLRMDVAVGLQRANHLKPDGGSRLPEAEAHYRAVLSGMVEAEAEMAAEAAAAEAAEAAEAAGAAAAAARWGGRGSDDVGSAAAAVRRQQLQAALQVRLGVWGNLAALLLEAERPHEALAELREALGQAEAGGLTGALDLAGAPLASPYSPSPSPGSGSGAQAGSSLVCGLRFNTGKALAAVGRTADSEAAYALAARGGVGLDPACFAKATAAMTRLPHDLAAHVRAAVVTAAESGLTGRLIRRAARQARRAAAARASGGGAAVAVADEGEAEEDDEEEEEQLLAAAGRVGSDSGAGVGGASAASIAVLAQLPGLGSSSNSGGSSSSSGSGSSGGSRSGKGDGGSDGGAAATAAASYLMAAAAAGGGRRPGGWLAPLSAQELGWLHFAAWRDLDGDPAASAEEAWDVLVKANQLLAPAPPYDPAADWRQLATLTSVFTRQLLQAAEAAEAAGERRPGGTGSQQGEAEAEEEEEGQPRGRRAVFVMGLPRSGSTLVETMLAALPGVWGAGEDTALAPLTTPVNQLLAARGLTQPDKLAEYGRRYTAAMLQRAAASGTGWGPGRPPLRVVDKMLRNLWLIGYIQLLLPGACLVVVARHPLDAGLSCYSQPFGYSGVPWAWSLEHIGEQIRMTAALVAHWRAHLPPGRLLTLHYEELVAAPEATARRLLAHCGLAWDPAVLAFHTSNRTVATASVAQVRQPLYSRSVGRWRKYGRQLAALAAQVAAEVREYEAAAGEAVARAVHEQRRLEEERGARAAKEAGQGREEQQRQERGSGREQSGGQREGAGGESGQTGSGGLAGRDEL
ncbi:hypothetical protein HXX76_008490 [Chlamydomonas incerta]|uniref:protein-tyrosine sulfotransferase n=1 Tax=Chlamydomonas incerta TaxID=51695 RepID=A0A835SU84_CHLIN|nr:hypothetical protein HXX76_008490 [Chlamydomonas incerta]|eukprot:KAG2433432.1 hypothetical protein HXX76_008490 [Chlamydomonas incerta]